MPTFKWRLLRPVVLLLNRKTGSENRRFTKQDGIGLNTNLCDPYRLYSTVWTSVWCCSLLSGIKNVRPHWQRRWQHTRDKEEEEETSSDRSPQTCVAPVKTTEGKHRRKMETIIKVSASKKRYVFITTSIVKLHLMETAVRFMHGWQPLLAHNRPWIRRAPKRAAKIMWLFAQAEICTGRWIEAYLPPKVLWQGVWCPSPIGSGYCILVWSASGVKTLIAGCSWGGSSPIHIDELTRNKQRKEENTEEVQKVARFSVLDF